jgi:hypothetical protein
MVIRFPKFTRLENWMSKEVDDLKVTARASEVLAAAEHIAQDPSSDTM